MSLIAFSELWQTVDDKLYLLGLFWLSLPPNKAPPSALSKEKVLRGHEQTEQKQRDDDFIVLDVDHIVGSKNRDIQDSWD